MSRTKLLCLCALSAALPLALTQSALGGSLRPATKVVVAGFDATEKLIAGRQGIVIPDTVRVRITEQLERARDAFSKRQTCAAARALRGYLDATQDSRTGRARALAEDLHNRGRELLNDVLSTRKGRACRGFTGFERDPIIKVTRSSNEGLRIAIAFGQPTFASVRGGRQTYTQVLIPGLQHGDGVVGAPDVPYLRRLVAVPKDAKISLRVRQRRVGERARVNLYPVQEQPIDGVSKPPSLRFFGDKPFKRNARLYRRKAASPRQPCSVRRIGDARDIEIAQIQCAAGQYNAVTDQLVLYRSLVVDVVFQGGEGTFATEESTGAFESLEEYTGGLLNGAEIFEFPISEAGRRFCLGEEFMILTHPDFRAAADTLAIWKNDKGITTRVFEVNDGAGPGPDTKEEIDALIHERFDNCFVRPSYVLLLGDAEFIPTFYVATTWSSTTGSDYEYALRGDPSDDNIPDFALGRIPVDTLEQANTVVNKIVKYESSPPAQRSFYENASFASQFQCCRSGSPSGRTQRGFIETSELARDELLDVGYSVERIYTKTGSGTPRRYYNGALLPTELGASSGFAWDGSN